MKKRICHISTVHRGVEIRIIRKEVASMAMAGYDAHAVIAATPEEVADAAKLNVTIHPLRDRKGRLARMTTKMFDAWNTARKLKADIYHFHDPELIPLGLFMKLCGHHVVMDVHEDLAAQTLNKHWIPLPIRKLVGKTARGFERLGARFFDGVATAAAPLTPFFEDVARPGRLVTVHNYPMLQELGLDPDKDNAPAPRPATHVIYAGGLSRIRGLVENVQATEKAGIKLIVAGEFKSEADKDAITSQAGWKDVEYLGWVDRKGIREALERSFAGLCTLYPTPNHLTSEPIKIFEYMAAGIPTIYSPIPNWIGYLEQHDIGIAVEPTDVDAIARAIVELRDNPERARQMGINGQKAVIEHYNWETQAKRLADLYQRILDNA